MTIYLKPFWESDMTMHSFALKSGVAWSTLNRWVKGLPQHPHSYLTLCVLLDCPPQRLIDKKFIDLCKEKGLTPEDVAALCGFNPFTIVREMNCEEVPPATALLQLDKIYKCCNSFEMAFDVDAIKADVIDRVNRIALAIAA